MNVKTLHAKHLNLVLLLQALLVSCSLHVAAQELPPAEPPAAMPGSAADQNVIHAQTTEVLVPTLVEKPDGSVVYGLTGKDFVLEDNGLQQKIHVQDEMDQAPVALVVAVEQGGASSLEFDKVAKLGPLLELFMKEGSAKAALVGFDSHPYLLQDFTTSQEKMTTALKGMEGGGGGAAILDSVSYAVDLLNEQPKEYRRVLLLISEERDHGSKHTKVEELIRKIGRSDVLVLSISFSPMQAELTHDIKDSGGDRALNMVSTLFSLVQAFRKNISKEIALMSGGEYATFSNDKNFEARVARSAKHARNRYLITFSPSDQRPGLHTIRVRTVDDYGAKIVARAHYWISGPEE